MEFTVRAITAEQTRPLRQQLLRQTATLEQLAYMGDGEFDTLHVGAFAGNDHIGIATVMCQPPNVSVGVPPTHPNPNNMTAWRLRGMAVTDAAQGKGVGAAMLKVCLGHVADQGGAFLWCDARLHAMPFYEKQGFIIMGERYTVPDVGPHHFMQRGIMPGDVALLDLYLDNA
jgi:GNAT superfamily N-acetyltransferase